jgi:hypothetical protein
LYGIGGAIAAIAIICDICEGLPVERGRAQGEAWLIIGGGDGEGDGIADAIASICKRDAGNGWGGCIDGDALRGGGA